MFKAVTAVFTSGEAVSKEPRPNPELQLHPDMNHAGSASPACAYISAEYSLSKSQIRALGSSFINIICALHLIYDESNGFYFDSCRQQWELLSRPLQRPHDKYLRKEFLHMCCSCWGRKTGHYNTSYISCSHCQTAWILHKAHCTHCCHDSLETGLFSVWKHPGTPLNLMNPSKSAQFIFLKTLYTLHSSVKTVSWVEPRLSKTFTFYCFLSQCQTTASAPDPFVMNQTFIISPSFSGFQEAHFAFSIFCNYIQATSRWEDKTWNRLYNTSQNTLFCTLNL